jgi:hypothetical protein
MQSWRISKTCVSRPIGGRRRRPPPLCPRCRPHRCRASYQLSGGCAEPPARDTGLACGSRPHTKPTTSRSRGGQRFGADVRTTVLSTQRMPETYPLQRACLGVGFIIAHRVSPPDAEMIAAQFGTRPANGITHQIDYTSGFSDKGSIRRVDKFHVHLNEFREFVPGQAALKCIAQALHDRPCLSRHPGTHYALTNCRSLTTAAATLLPR